MTNRTRRLAANVAETSGRVESYTRMRTYIPAFTRMAGRVDRSSPDADGNDGYQQLYGLSKAACDPEGLVRDALDAKPEGGPP